MRLVALALAALALAGCETTAEKSARLEREAKHHAIHASAVASALQELASRPAGTHVRVTGSTLLHNSEGTAAVVSLRNTTARDLREVPILLTVADSSGHSLYTNNAPGLSRTLTGIALLPAHASLSWIDDQLQAAGAPAHVTVKVGEGTPAGGGSGHVSVTGTLSEATASGGTVEGTVTNGSSRPQRELVVYATAQRSGRAVAAGRAVLAEVAPGDSQHYQLFLIGNPSGASLHLEAPPTS